MQKTAATGPDGYRYSYDPGGNLLTRLIGTGDNQYAVDAASNRILAAYQNGQSGRKPVRHFKASKQDFDAPGMVT